MANTDNFLFFKVLSDTDVEHRLHWPAEYVNLFPAFGGNHQVDFLVKDISGRHFTFRCSRRRNGAPKHVISAGWKSFVDSKGGLNPNDKVIFYRNVGPDALFVVSVQRRSIRLLGENIYNDEE